MTIQESIEYDCGDGPEWLLDFHRAMTREYERRLSQRGGEAMRAKWHRARQTESELVAVLLRMAAGLSGEERAVVAVVERRDDEGPAERLARDHGWHDDRLTAMRGLAASRGVSLEHVLRAAMRGDLREVVQMPPLDRRNPTEGEES